MNQVQTNSTSREAIYYRKVAEILEGISVGRMTASDGFTLQNKLFNSFINNTISTFDLERQCADCPRACAIL